jgi:hypothetical protein
MASKPKFARKYAGWTIALGAALGAVLGAIAGNMGVWLVIGVVIGIVIGASYRRKDPACPECEAMHQEHQARNQAWEQTEKSQPQLRS